MLNLHMGKVDKNKELKTKFIEYYRQLPVQKLAADFIGKDETTISRWKKDDEEFANQIALSGSAWALENSKRVRSKEWLLERIMKPHFAECKEVAGPDGNKLQIEFVNPDKKTYGEGTASDE